MSNIFKDFDLVKGTGMKASIAGAGAILNGYQAVRARVDYGNKMIEIKNYDDNRQEIKNPFGQLENPYKNLAVATQAAEIKMEQTDQALANTLDTLRETGAAAGGATAIANAALKSKQGVAASIETQEINNQKLQAQGQLQVDIAKGKGEMERFDNQEARDIAKLNRLQSQADVLKGQQQSATLGAIQGLTNVGNTLIGGMTAADLPDAPEGTTSGFDANGNPISIAPPSPTANTGNNSSFNFSQGQFSGNSPFNAVAGSNSSNNSVTNNFPGSDSTTLSNFSKLSGIDTGKNYKDSTRLAMWEELEIDEEYKGSAEQNNKILEQQKIKYLENNLSNNQ